MADDQQVLPSQDPQTIPSPPPDQPPPAASDSLSSPAFSDDQRPDSSSLADESQPVSSSTILPKTQSPQDAISQPIPPPPVSGPPPIEASQDSQRPVSSVLADEKVADDLPQPVEPSESLKPADEPATADSGQTPPAEEPVSTPPVDTTQQALQSDVPADFISQTPTGRPAESSQPEVSIPSPPADLSPSPATAGASAGLSPSSSLDISPFHQTQHFFNLFHQNPLFPIFLFLFLHLQFRHQRSNRKPQMILPVLIRPNRILHRPVSARNRHKAHKRLKLIRNRKHPQLLR